MKSLSRTVLLLACLSGVHSRASDCPETLLKTWKFDHASCSSSTSKVFNPYEPFKSVTLEISPTKITELFSFTPECSFSTVSDYQISGVDLVQRISSVKLPTAGEDTCGYNVNDKVGDVLVSQLFEVGGELQLFRPLTSSECPAGEKVVYTFR